MNIPQSTKLDPSLKCSETNQLIAALQELVIGQDEAINIVANVVQTFKAGMQEPNRPLANILCLGSTGVGKTRLIEALAKVLFGNEAAFIKVNCGELNGKNSSSTLVGALPGYIGYKSGETIITQEKLDKYKTKEHPFSIVLFDEIEKAAEDVNQSLLNITDRAKLRLNTGAEVDFTNTIIFLTSNLGAQEFNEVTNLGFTHKNAIQARSDSKISSEVVKAAEKHFSPEFMNRLNHVIVFNKLSKTHIKRIFDIELNYIRRSVALSKAHNKYTFICTQVLEDYIIEKGYSAKYGARHLKRVITKLVREPLSSISITGQIDFGDLIVLSIDANNEITYEKISGEDIYFYNENMWEELREYIIKKETTDVVSMLQQES